jgi:hypothetical protein
MFIGPALGVLQPVRFLTTVPPADTLLQLRT